MQNKLLTLLCAAAVLLATGARAQDNTIATPSTPAPAVQQAAPQQTAQPAPQQPAQAPAAPVAQAPVAQVAPTPNQIIYSPRLPSPSELTSAAQAQGQTVEQIIQSSSQITVVYRAANGQTNTVAYQLLPTAGVATTATVVTPAPTVVYQTVPTTVYYEPYYRTYDPFWDDYWSPPVSLNFGFGYYHGWGGGYRGGWHDGWRGGGHHWR